MKNLKKMAVCAGASAIIGAMAVGTVSAEEVELSIFHYQEQYQEQFDKLVEMYKEVKPDVSISVECIGSDYDKILQTRVASGEVPDIFMSGPNNKNELYASVSYDFQNEEGILGDINLGPEFWAENGELTAIPFTSQAWGIIYNKDIFEAAGITELPQTLDEMREVCNTLKEAGYTPFVEGFGSSYVVSQLFGFTYAVDDNYSANIEQLKNKEAELKDMEFIGKIFDGTAVIRENCQENAYDDDFASSAAKLGLGEAAMTTNGDWIVENAMKANPDANLGMMALPLSNDPADTKIYYSNSTGLHISKDSAHIDEALAFIEWLVTSQEGKDWFSNDMVTMSSISGVAPQGSPVLNDALALIGEGKYGPWGSGIFPSGIGDEMQATLDKFLLGEIEKEEAIEELNEIWAYFE